MTIPIGITIFSAQWLTLLFDSAAEGMVGLPIALIRREMTLMHPDICGLPCCKGLVIDIEPTTSRFAGSPSKCDIVLHLRHARGRPSRRLDKITFVPVAKVAIEGDFSTIRLNRNIARHRREQRD